MNPVLNSSFNKIIELKNKIGIKININIFFNLYNRLLFQLKYTIEKKEKDIKNKTTILDCVK